MIHSAISFLPPKAEALVQLRNAESTRTCL